MKLDFSKESLLQATGVICILKKGPVEENIDLKERRKFNVNVCYKKTFTNTLQYIEEENDDYEITFEFQLSIGYI